MTWQPIETAPKDGSKIMISGDSYVTIGWWEEDKGKTLISADKPYWEPYDFSYWDRYDIGDWFTPTHWMPLPTPATVERPS